MDISEVEGKRYHQYKKTMGTAVELSPSPPPHPKKKNKEKKKISF